MKRGIGKDNSNENSEKETNCFKSRRTELTTISQKENLERKKIIKETLIVLHTWKDQPVNSSPIFCSTRHFIRSVLDNNAIKL